MLDGVGAAVDDVAGGFSAEDMDGKSDAGVVGFICCGVDFRFGIVECTVIGHQFDGSSAVVNVLTDTFADFVGRVLPNVGLLTPFGRAFIAEEPVVSDDLINDASFSQPSYYAEYGVVSVLVVPIKSEAENFVTAGNLLVFRSHTGGQEWNALNKGITYDK